MAGRGIRTQSAGLVLAITLALSIMASSLNGCASTPPLPEETYLLDAGVSAAGGVPRKASRPADKVLLVSTPQAQPGFDSRRIAYTRTPWSLDYYTKSEWADTPARMLAPLVVRTLESSGGFRAVVNPPTPVPYDLRLDIDIIRFQQEFLEQPSRMRITLRARLIDMATFQILSTRVFEALEAAPSENAYGGVQAANIALERLLEELAEFVLSHGSSQTAKRAAKT